MNRLLTITWFSIFSINIIVGQGNYENNWVSYYKPVDNKIFGIWPHIKRYSDIERLKELKYKWGYNHIFLAQNLE
ncbi:MAG: hypothetical protein H6609_14410 [Ignavibacteriales bacterium]|nr:hypothetical protein [Ignavibacteriales bacterium]